MSTQSRELTRLSVGGDGVRHLVVTVPAERLPLPAARRYCAGPVVALREADDQTVLDLRLTPADCQAPGDTCSAAPPARPDREEAAGLAAAAQQALAGGDRRLLHLAWLVAVQHGCVDDDEPQPPPPARWSHLSEELNDLADLFGLSADMVAASADSRPGARRPAAHTVGALLHREAVLASARARADRLAREERVRAWAVGVGREDAAWVRRTLARGGADGPAVWRQVDALVARGGLQEYRRAVAVLVSVRQRVPAGGSADYDRRLLALRRRHAGRGVFLATLDRAGLDVDASVALGAAAAWPA